MGRGAKKSAPSSPPGAPAERLSVLVLGPGHVSTRLLSPGQPCRLELRQDGEVIACELTATEEGSARIQAEAELRLNDVQVGRGSTARPGDQLSWRDWLLVLERSSERAASPDGPSAFDDFRRIAAHEIRRALAEGARLHLVLLRTELLPPSRRGELLSSIAATLPRAMVGELGPHLLQVLLPPDGTLDALRSFGALVYGADAQPSWSRAELPTDGARLEALAGRALDRLGEAPAFPTEPAHASPAMHRLYAVAERLRSAAHLLLAGEEGVGRETFARHLHALRGLPPERFVVYAARVFDEASWREALGRAFGGTLFVRDYPALPPAARAAVPPLAFVGTLFEAQAAEGEHVVRVPALRDRPEDILPLAEELGARAATVLGRRRPARLTEPSQRRLLRHDWPGNLRELQYVMLRATAVCTGDEIHPSDLPIGPAAETLDEPAAGFRQALRAVERQALLRALNHSHWNVTRAAESLGLPRRTVVYRMSRLGLRRPHG